MESLLHYLTAQQTQVQHLIACAGTPTQEQLCRYLASMSQQLGTKLLSQAPPNVKEICSNGIRSMGELSYIFHHAYNPD